MPGPGLRECKNSLAGNAPLPVTAWVWPVSPAREVLDAVGRLKVEIAFIFLLIIMLLMVGYTGWQQGVVRTVSRFDWEEDEIPADSGPGRLYS
jgi:hypothetical protein